MLFRKFRFLVLGLLLFWSGLAAAAALSVCETSLLPSLKGEGIPSFMEEIYSKTDLTDDQKRRVFSEVAQWMTSQGIKYKNVGKGTLGTWYGFVEGFEILPDKSPEAHFINRLAAKVSAWTEDALKGRTVNPKTGRELHYRVLFAPFFMEEGGVDGASRYLFVDVQSLILKRSSAVLTHELVHLRKDLEFYQGRPLALSSISLKVGKEMINMEELWSTRISNELALRDLRKIHQSTGSFKASFAYEEYLLEQSRDLLQGLEAWRRIYKPYRRWLKLGRVTGDSFIFEKVSGHRLDTRMHSTFANHPFEYLMYPLTKSLGVFELLRERAGMDFRLSPEDYARLFPKEQVEAFLTLAQKDFVLKKIDEAQGQVEILFPVVEELVRKAEAFEREPSLDALQELERAHKGFGAVLERMKMP